MVHYMTNEFDVKSIDTESEIYELHRISLCGCFIDSIYLASLKDDSSFIKITCKHCIKIIQDIKSKIEII